MLQTYLNQAADINHGNLKINYDPSARDPNLFIADGLILALNFYSGTESQHSNDSNLVRECNHLVKSQQSLQNRQMIGPAIDEVHAWMDKALELIDPYVGVCSM